MKIAIEPIVEKGVRFPNLLKHLDIQAELKSDIFLENMKKFVRICGKCVKLPRASSTGDINQSLIS